MPKVLPHQDVKKLLALAVLLSVLACPVQAQDRTRLDQLMAELGDHARNDTANVDLLIRISEQHRILRTDSANHFLREALALSRKIHFLRGEARTHQRLASGFEGNFDSTFYYLRSAIDAAKRAGDTGTLGHAYLSLSYAVLTGTYRLTTNRDAVNTDAGAYADSAVAAFQATRDTAWWINGLTRQAGIFMDQDSMSQAGAALRKALFIQSSSSVKGDPVATLYFTLGDYHFQRSEFDSALVYHKKAVPILEEQGSAPGVAYAYGLIARDHAHLRQFDLAIANAEHGLRIAEENGLVKEKLDALTALCQVYREKGDLAKALTYYERLYRESDSLNTARLREISSKFDIQLEAQRSRERITVLLKDKQIQEQQAARQRIIVFALISGFVCVLLFAVVFLFQRNRISKARKRSDELLLNILPEEVAEELKAKGEAVAVHIDQVTVLFTDFKGFTAMSEVVTPRQLVHDLHECFSAFDKITEKHGIEKIKTIGDAYMAAGGLPTPNTTHPMDVIKAAFEMRDFIAEGKARKIAAGLPYFEIRIGIHTGPVVAGIVGVKKFQYDIWGDTVNTASRMESSGEVGQVNISEATYQLVSAQLSVVSSGLSGHSLTTGNQQLTTPAFTFTPRGKVQAKGKGEMEMYFVTAQRAT